MRDSGELTKEFSFWEGEWLRTADGSTAHLSCLTALPDGAEAEIDIVRLADGTSVPFDSDLRERPEAHEHIATVPATIRLGTAFAKHPIPPTWDPFEFHDWFRGPEDPPYQHELRRWRPPAFLVRAGNEVHGAVTPGRAPKRLHIPDPPSHYTLILESGRVLLALEDLDTVRDELRERVIAVIGHEASQKESPSGRGGHVPFCRSRQRGDYRPPLGDL